MFLGIGAALRLPVDTETWRLDMTEKFHAFNQWPRRARITAAALLCTTMLTGAAALGGVWPAAADQATAPLAAATAWPEGFANVVDAVKPAVVNIAVDKAMPEAVATGAPDLPGLSPDSPMGDLLRKFRQQQPDDGDQRHMPKGHAVGSGFIIDASGYIVTNNHVVDGADKINVTLADGTSFDAKVIGTDKKTDLALVKIDAGKSLPYVQFGDSDKARIGDWVVAIGDPFGLGGSVTAGILSARGRDIGSGPYDDFLQVDAPINPGNSGGPLFDRSGKVIGVPTAIYSPNGGSVGIGFAIPAATATKVVAALRDHGSVERGWLGLQMQPVTDELAQAMGLPKAQGVLINKVEPDSPAAKAELAQGDVITAFDGKPIKQPRDLARFVAEARGKADLTLWRQGKEQTVAVTIGTMPAEHLAAAAAPSDAKGPQVGVSLAPLTADTRDALGLDAAVKGVVVAAVKPGSKAADSGLQQGDIILGFGGDKVATPKEAVSKIREAQATHKKSLPILVMRDGTTMYLALQIA
jgi:serine protease Do